MSHPRQPALATLAVLILWNAQAIVASAIDPGELTSGPFQKAFPRGEADAALFLQGFQETLAFRSGLLAENGRQAKNLAQLTRKFIIRMESIPARSGEASLPMESFSLSDADFFHHLQGGRQPEAINAFSAFQGKWYGRWDQTEVDHDWHPVIEDEQNVDDTIIYALQYAWIGDGFGWNILAGPPGEDGRKFILGSVHHLQNGNPDEIIDHVAHAGIAAGANALIWVTRREVFLEQTTTFSEKEAYSIAGFSYRQEAIAYSGSGAFQALYTRDPSNRPAWIRFGFSGNERLDADHLKLWLQNMVWHHAFSTDEIQAATGLPRAAIDEYLRDWKIDPATKPQRNPRANLLALPYPGGRHPRIGFLDGAVNPQRETKVSIFTPWDPSSYVVADLPEAIWSNLGLTYLAHTHIDTIWTKDTIELEPLEWERLPQGILRLHRNLPNGIAFTSWVAPKRDHVLMTLVLHNETDETLTDLRVQNCVMLKGAEGFAGQTNDNKRLKAPFAACHDEGTGPVRRWIITAWEPCHRAWANPPVPCLHADPKFPDCRPGETKILQGWLSFYEGSDIEEEFDRIEQEWEKPSLERWESWTAETPP